MSIPSADSVRTRRKTRRRVVLAIVVTLVVVGAFFVGREVWWGLRPTPEFDSMVSDPDPSLVGTVAFQGSGADGCVSVVAAAGGEPHQVTCVEGFKGGGSLRWLPDGRLQYTHHPDPHIGGAASSVIIDVVTGDTVEVPDDEVPPPSETDEFEPGPNGEIVETSSSRGELTLSLTDDQGTRELLSVGAPSTYTLTQLAWSPDGSWFVVKDDLDQLLLVTTGASSRTRVLAISAWGAAATDRDFAKALAPDDDG